MRPLELLSLSLSMTFAAGCAAPVDDASPDGTVEASHESSAASGLTLTGGYVSITPIPIPDGQGGYISITPIPIPEGRPLNDVIAADTTGIYYLSSRSSLYGSFYSAVHVGFDGTILSESASLYGLAPKPHALSVKNNAVVFSDASHIYTMPLDSSIKPTIANVLLLTSTISTTVTPVVTYKTGSLPFSLANEISFDGSGGVGFEGGGGIGLVSSSIYSFEGGGGVGYYSFEGVGGITCGTGFTSFEGGGGIGVWAASASTPSLARVTSDGAAIAVPLTWAAAGTTAYTGSFPRHLRTVGTTALVVTADRRVLMVRA